MKFFLFPFFLFNLTIKSWGQDLSISIPGSPLKISSNTATSGDKTRYERRATARRRVREAMEEEAKAIENEEKGDLLGNRGKAKDPSVPYDDPYAPVIKDLEEIPWSKEAKRPNSSPKKDIDYWEFRKQRENSLKEAPAVESKEIYHSPDF